MSKTLKMSHDIAQKKLLGKDGELGTGFIPKDAIIKTVLAHGGEGALDRAIIRHVSGRPSTLFFRTAAAGRENLQGVTLHHAWLDEEVPLDIYSEVLARLVATNGQLLASFTPLEGVADLVLRYIEQPSADRAFVTMGYDDLPAAEGEPGALPGGPYGHIPVSARASIIAAFPPHEREARSKGVPSLGSGRIYTTADEAIIENVDPNSFPTWYRWIWGVDFGMQHPFAAVLCAWDSETGNDVFHLVAEVVMSDSTIAQQVDAIKQTEWRLFKSHALEIPVSWPHDGGQRDRLEGKPFQLLYKQRGLRMLSECATLPKLKGREAHSVEAGVAEIVEREKTGRWKVNGGMSNYLRERAIYHRKDGQINHVRNDTLDACRYAFMMRRYVKPMDECGGAVLGTAAFSSWVRRDQARHQKFAKGSVNAPGGEGWDIWTGKRFGS